MSTDLAGSGLVYGSPSVPLARPPTTPENLQGPAPHPPAFVQLPFSMCQASTASWPVRFPSEFAKHGPVYTSAVRASMYWPEICAIAGTASTRDKTRNNPFSFIDSSLQQFLIFPPPTATCNPPLSGVVWRNAVAPAPRRLSRNCPTRCHSLTPFRSTSGLRGSTVHRPRGHPARARTV